jgi:hypothetical protein
MKYLLLLICFPVYASSLTYEFNDPSFSGTGWSQHVLSVEQMEQTRKQKIKDDEKAAIAKIESDKKNTNLAKFLVNVESRIYAQLSKQMADAMFGESSANQGSMDFQGTNINWVKGATDVSLTITEPSGNITDITVPIGTFGF